MYNISIIMTTAPRPKPTVNQSVESLRRAGFTQELILVCDGGLPNIKNKKIEFIENKPNKGGLRNWAYALELGVAKKSDFILMLEDDITWVKGSASELNRDLSTLKYDISLIGYMSLYTCNKVSKEIEKNEHTKGLKRGYYKSKLGWSSWGSQAYLIPKASAVRLLEDPQFIDFRENYKPNKNRDNVVSKCFLDINLHTLHRIPCLVSHELGDANSSLRLKPSYKALQAKYYTGKP